MSILSTVLGDNYASFNGTSMATPHVAGAAALAWDLLPSLTATQMKQLLMSNVDDISAIGNNALKPTQTGGRLNVFNALNPDFTPPAAVNDLALSSAELFSISVGWTAVGDDGMVGQAASYDMRYATIPITEANWASATQAVGEPAPQLSGSAESFTITGLDHGATYFIGLKVIDEVNNESGLSNVVQASTQAATIVFQDNMESGQGGWTAAGVPGLWHLSQRRANSPTTAWYYGSEATGNYDTGAANNGTLTSQAISLSQASEASLFFSEWSEVESLESFDRTRMQISTDNVNWTTIFESHGTAGIRADRSLNINQYVGGDIYLRFWFDTRDRFFNAFEGWYVDDVLVLALVPGGNSPPVAVNDAYAVAEDTVLAIAAPGVLANDTDPENDPLTAILVSGPANGGVVLNANGSFTYTPALNFNGADSFTYEANDGVADSNVATVSITVNQVNDPPVADPGGPYNGTVGVAVAFNGSGSSDPENSPLTYDWDFGDASPMARE